MHVPVRRLVLILLASSGTLGLGATTAQAHGLLVATDVEGGRTLRATPTSPRLELATHRVHIDVQGPVARVQVEQRFRSLAERPLEGTYLFPLPEGAAVSNFAMTLDGRMVRGEVMDAREARAIYERIVQRRRDPGLLEYVGRGLFRARVFPIPPRGDVDIRLSYEQVLPDHDGTLELRYPLATDRLHGQPVADLVVTVDVTSDVPVRGVYSPSHALAVARQGETKVHASYEGSGSRQVQDLLVYVGRSPDHVGCSVLGHRVEGEDGTFLAVFAPSARAPEVVVPKDVIFVLDTSGSMREDDKIGQARRALEFGLGVLREEDRFGIVAFSAQATRFRNRLREASPAARDEARAWLRGLAAEGGTNLHDALHEALDLVESDRLTVVLLLSDGRPTVGVRDAPSIVAAVKAKNAGRARVFTFGVGFDLDVALLDLVAEATRGARDYVLPREELEIATSRFFRKIVDPVLTDLELDVGEGAYDVYPHSLPDLFAGEQIVVLGRYRLPGPRRLVLRGRRGDDRFEHVYEVSFPAREEAAFLPRLWAQRKVAFLLDEIRLHGEDLELVDAVRTLALAHGLVTPYTSHLVTDDAELDRARGDEGRSPRGRGVGRGSYRGPSGEVPPGLRRPSDPTPPPPPPPTGPPPTTPTTPSAGTPPPAGAVAASKRLRDAKERDREPEDARVRRVGGRTFTRQGERWVDTAYDEKVTPRKIVAFTEAWLALTRSDERLAQILALGDRVVVVWGEEVYEVVPE